MKRQWLAILFLFTLVCCLLCSAGAETVNVDPSIIPPANIQVTATKVGQPFTVTWDGEEMQDYEIHLHDETGRIVRWFYPNYNTYMFYDIFRQMPGTYTIGIQANVWLDYEKYSSEEIISQPFTVAAAGKTWDYVIVDGKAKIKAYYGNDTDVAVPETLDGYAVNEIGDFAFNCRDIYSISLPSSVTQINAYAFADSSLRTLTVGGQVRMDATAFSGCTDLVVTGMTGSDAENAANSMDIAFVSAGNLPEGPEVIRNEELDDEYNWYFSVSDPDAERYEYKALRKYSSESEYEYYDNAVLETFYSGEVVNVALYRNDSTLSEIDVQFRAFKDGTWSKWTEPIIVKNETASGDTELNLEGAVQLTASNTSLEVHGKINSLIRIDPEITEEYTFFTNTEYDTYGTLFDANGNVIVMDDDGGENTNFKISETLIAGNTYYLGVRFYNDYEEDTVIVYTECSAFTVLPVPAIEVDKDVTGGLVVKLSAENADSYRIRVKYMYNEWDYHTVEEVLESSGGIVSYAIDPDLLSDCYAEVSASVAFGDNSSPMTKPITLKGLYDGVWNGFEWKQETNGEITIINYNGHDSRVIVPETISGHPVTTIGQYAFVNNREITSVVLPEGIKTIKQRAFTECSSLYSVHLPDSLETIEGEAFYDCYQLACVNLPTGMDKIDFGAFRYCNNLKWISFSENFNASIEECAFEACGNLIIEDQTGGTGWVLAACNGYAFSKVDDEGSQSKQVPELSVSGTAYYSKEISVNLSMPGADLFRVKERQVWNAGDNYTYNEIAESEIESTDGTAIYPVYCSYDCLTHFVLVSARVDGVWTPWSNVIEIKPGYEGRLDKPVPVIDGTITAGQEYRIYWSTVEHASYYEVYVEQPNSFSLLYAGDTLETAEDAIWYLPAGDYQLTVIAGSDDSWLSSESEPISLHVARGTSDYLYTVSDDGIHINSYIGPYTEEEISVPSTIDGIPVVSLDNAAFVCLEARRITVPETVKTVGYRVINHCPSLESVVFNGPVVINESILYDCPNMTFITFNHAGAEVYGSTVFLDYYTYRDNDLTLYGLTGSTIEEYANIHDYEFVSVGTMPACPEFIVTPLIEHEDGLAHPDEGVKLCLNDPETEKIEYRVAFTYLYELSPSSRTYQFSANGINGVFEEEIAYYEYSFNPMISVRAYRNGFWTAWSEPVSMGYVTDQLPKVTGIQISFVDGKGTVTWNPIENADEYRVFIQPKDCVWSFAEYSVHNAESCTFYYVDEPDQYDIYVVATKSKSGDLLFGEWSDKVTVTLTPYPGDSFFEVSTTEGIININEVIAYVYAKDATNFQIRYVDEIGIEHIWFECEGQCCETMLRVEGTHTYVAYASWDYGDSWQEIGSQTVTCSYLGDLENPVIHTAPYLRIGEDLVISVDAIENAIQYNLSVRDIGNDNWLLDEMITPEQTVTLPASLLAEASDNIEIYAYAFADGYRSGYKHKYVDILPTTVNPISMSANEATFVVGGTVKYTVNAPGASCVLLAYDEDHAYTYEHPDQNGVCTFSIKLTQSGEHVAYARAYYGDIEDLDNVWDSTVYDGPSEAVIVQCESLGKVPLPDVTIQSPTENDPFIVATIVPNGVADQYGLILYENHSYLTEFNIPVDPEQPMERLTITYPSCLLRKGATYTAYIRSQRYSYEASEQYVTGFTYVYPGAEEERYLSVSSNTGIVDISPVSVLVHAEDAECIKLNYVNDSGDEIERYLTWADTLRYTINDDFDYELIAYATYDGGENWEEIGRSKITISYLGDLNTPQIQIPAYLRKGEDMYIRVPNVENVDRYYLYIVDCDTHEYIVDRYLTPGESITVPTSSIHSNRYEVHYSAERVGYRSAADYRYVDVLPETEHDITLSVDRTSVVIGDRVTLTVNAPGANCVLLAYDEDHTYTYEHPDQNGVCTFSIELTQSGEHVAYARAYYGDIEDLDNVWDNTVYDGPSEVVIVQCESLGKAPLPDVTIQSPTENDPFITATIVPNDIADRYVLYLYENGSNIETFDIRVDPDHPLEPHTVTYPSTALRNGSTYTAEVKSQRYAYEFTQQNVPAFSYIHNGTEEVRYFSVSSNTGIVDVSPIIALVHAEGADGICLCRGDDNPDDHWTITWDETLRYTFSSENNDECVAYATYDDGETWEEIGRQMITMTYLGDLSTPMIHVPAYLKTGEDMVICVDAVENVEKYYLRICDYGIGEYILDRYVTPGETITISASQISGNNYEVYCCVEKAGYRNATVYKYIDVLPETKHGITLSVDQENIVVGDRITFTINAPGADSFLLYRNGGQCVSGTMDQSGSIQYEYNYDYPAEDQWYARAYYKEDGYEPDGPSEVVTVRCESLGNAPLPEVMIQCPDENDPFITATIVPNGIADRYALYLHENGSDIKYFDILVDPDQPFETQTVTYPSTVLRNGCTYTAYIKSYRYGYETTGHDVPNFSYMQPGTEEERYFRASSNTGIVDISPVIVVAHAEGASDICLCRTTESPYDGYYTRTWSETLHYTFDYACDETVVAYASYDDGETWEEIGSEAISVSYLGRLEAPEILIDLYLLEGEDLIMNPTIVENEENCVITFWDTDTGNHILDGKAYKPGESIIIPAELLTGTNYYINVYAQAKGYFSYSTWGSSVKVLKDISTLRLPAGTTKIETEAFAETGVEYVIIPNGTISIDARAFANCYDLKVVEVPASVTQIDDTAFDGCYNIMIRTEEGSTAFVKFANRDGFYIKVIK